MTTRDLIETIRANATGNEEFNALLLECASKIEEFLGGPEEEGSYPVPGWLNHRSFQTGEEAEAYADLLIGGGILQLQDDGRWHVFGLSEMQDRIKAGLPV